MSKKILPVMMLTVLVLFCFFTPVPAAQAFENVEQGIGAMHEIMEYIYNHHLSRPEVDGLTEGAIRGMIETLQDPYTEYLSPENLSKFVSSLDGGFSGIGVELEAQEPYPVVTRVIAGSPAAQAGLRAGDQIRQVDGEDLAERPLPEVVEKIRGPQGSPVRLTIRRPGAGEFTVEIKRAEVVGPTCEWRMLPENAGYIYIHTFGTRTAEEFKGALAELQKAGLKGLILDLRNDPGGYLQAAVDIAGCFLPPGKLVVTTLDRDGDREEYKTAGEGNSFTLPLVVLINQYSASAAEVLAGALADHRAAVLLGTRSYGKGVVQAVIPLQAGGALKMTIARYLTPQGVSIDQNGLLPDRLVSTPELQLILARQLINFRETRQIRFAVDGSGVVLDGEKVGNRWIPLRSQEGNEFYLPLRFTLEAIGYEVKWQESTGEIAVKGKGREFFFPLNGKNLLVSDGTAYLKTDFFRLIGVRIYQQGDELILET
ncbi:MAG: PDZ domain-containing protein [Armatimonadetes bacterium]|nr:PDZ domain-containing protein [Armatimonadota bacterium]